MRPLWAVPHCSPLWARLCDSQGSVQAWRTAQALKAAHHPRLEPAGPATALTGAIGGTCHLDECCRCADSPGAVSQGIVVSGALFALVRVQLIDLGALWGTPYLPSFDWQRRGQRAGSVAASRPVLTAALPLLLDSPQVPDPSQLAQPWPPPWTSGRGRCPAAGWRLRRWRRGAAPAPTPRWPGAGGGRCLLLS